MALEQVGVSRDHYLAGSTLGRMSVVRSKELMKFKAKCLELYSENFDKCCKVQRQNHKGPVSLLQRSPVELLWGSKTAGLCSSSGAWSRARKGPKTGRDKS